MASSMLTASASSSPSTRRAWIEMQKMRPKRCARAVALHPEGVDRNWSTAFENRLNNESPSTRRAWIEINGVGWNKYNETRRPPPGGRG